MFCWVSCIFCSVVGFWVCRFGLLLIWFLVCVLVSLVLVCLWIRVCLNLVVVFRIWRVNFFCGEDVLIGFMSEWKKVFFVFSCLIILRRCDSDCVRWLMCIIISVLFLLICFSICVSIGCVWFLFEVCFLWIFV